MLSLLSLSMPLIERAKTGTGSKHAENVVTFVHMVSIAEIKAKTLRLG